MEQALGSLLSIAVLMVAGYLLAKQGLFPEKAVEGLRLLITNLTLPLVMFRAFLLLHLEGRNLALAVVVFFACAAMGIVGAAIGRLMHAPSPETRFLYQGFEAGMLGYVLFGGFYGAEQLPAFAALDIGQVIYVFTVLMVQMNMAEQARASRIQELQEKADMALASKGHGASSQEERCKMKKRSMAGTVFPWRDIVNSKVLWAICLGVVLSIAAPEFAQRLGEKNVVMNMLFAMVGGLTTPLVCLVIGASLSGGLVLSREVVWVVATRLVVALAMGFGMAHWVVPALGFGVWQRRAALIMFVLPPPFIIPVYYKGNIQFVSSVLTLFTLIAIVTVALLVLLGVV